jgi:hypothetical protein
VNRMPYARSRRGDEYPPPPRRLSEYHPGLLKSIAALVMCLFLFVVLPIIIVGFFIVLALAVTL